MMSETTTAKGSRLARSFSKKKIDITFTIRSSADATARVIDQEKLSGYRCQIEVTNAGLKMGSNANVRIYGLPLPLMNRMSLMPARIPGVMSDLTRTTYNSILIEAGDDERGMTTIFNGVIFTAFADFSSAPEPAFNIVSYNLIQPNTKVIAPHAFPAGTSVAGMVSQVASDAGYSFVNYGVNLKAPGPTYLYGTVIDQIDQLHQAFRFIYSIPAVGTTGQASPYQVTIWSNNLQDLKGKTIPKVSAKTGMIGYPAYSNYGVSLVTLFDHRLQFMNTFAIDSAYLPAAWVNNQAGQVAPMPVNGTWVAQMVTHELDSEIPNGRWFTRVEAMRTDYAGNVSYNG